MAELQLIFVGTGDAFNTGGRASQSLWIRIGSKNVLLDCGPTALYRLRCLNLSPNDLDAVVFTHFHGDHFLGVTTLDLSLTVEEKRSRGLWYAGPVGLRKQFEQLYYMSYPGVYPNERFPRNFQEYVAGGRYTLCDLAISPVAVDHSPCSLGYRIRAGNKTIGITGDTCWCEGLIALANDTDIFITECTHYAAAQNPQHLSYEELKKNKKMLKTSRVIMLHTGEEVLNRRDALEFEIAYDGMQISL